MVLGKIYRKSVSKDCSFDFLKTNTKAIHIMCNLTRIVYKNKPTQLSDLSKYLGIRLFTIYGAVSTCVSGNLQKLTSLKLYEFLY